MPIRKDLRHHYKGDWPALSLRVREEAGWKCERCGRPNKITVLVSDDGSWRKVFTHNDGWSPPWFGPDGHPRPLDWSPSNLRLVITVLTVAHLDQDPTNNDRSNLAALCQRCHNVHDAPHRARHARETCRRRRGPLLPLPASESGQPA